MNREDEDQLREWLRDLLSKQDKVTHLNEKGMGRTDAMLTAIEQRQLHIDRIVQFVKRLIRKQQS